MIFRNKLQRQKLLSDSDIQFLQDIAVARDEANNGATRHEMVGIIHEMTGKDRKSCENCWDNIIRTKKMQELKSAGKVKKVQATTMKRSEITVEQQLRWHSTVDESFETLKELNKPCDLFESVMENFCR